MVNYHQLKTGCGRTPPPYLSLHYHFLSSDLMPHLVPHLTVLYILPLRHSQYNRVYLHNNLSESHIGSLCLERG
jgi:hypothetical protein